MKILPITAALLLCLLTAIPHPAHASEKLSPAARQTLHTAQQLIDSKKFAQAADVLQKFVNSGQKGIDAQVWLSLGGALYKAGKKSRAAKAYLKGHSAYPANKQLCLNAGITLYETKHYAKAGSCLEKAYALQKPRDPKLLYQSGSAFYLGKKYRNAARVLQKLLARHNKQAHKEWIRLAIHSLLQSRQIAKAESMLLRYLNISPGEADYWQLLAKLHMERGKYANAAAALEICYRLKRPSRGELERLASLYQYRRAPLLAVRTLKRAYGNSPGPKQALKVAALLASAGRIQQAVKYLNRHARSGSTILKKGKLLYEARRFKEAEAVFNKLKKVPEAHFYLALCAWEREDWKLARQELGRLTKSKQFKNQARGYMTVLNDLEQARREAAE